ncbi:hypothetical protein BC828DRAFT_287304 [Blastocladiella britannica]|nr:hypothetical protein BC828DRAFT_287304 [Blastocladiella britannica]
MNGACGVRIWNRPILAPPVQHLPPAQGEISFVGIEPSRYRICAGEMDGSLWILELQRKIKHRMSIKQTPALGALLQAEELAATSSTAPRLDTGPVEAHRQWLAFTGTGGSSSSSSRHDNANDDSQRPFDDAWNDARLLGAPKMTTTVPLPTTIWPPHSTTTSTAEAPTRVRDPGLRIDDALAEWEGATASTPSPAWSWDASANVARAQPVSAEVAAARARAGKNRVLMLAHHVKDSSSSLPPSSL